jgi:hypothetical protein
MCCTRLLGREGMGGKAGADIDAAELEVKAPLLSGRIPENATGGWHGVVVEDAFELDTDGGTAELGISTWAMLFKLDDAGGTFDVEGKVEDTGFVGFATLLEVEA